MLLSFSLSNFRSFDTEQTLNCVAQRRFKQHEDRLISLPNSDIRLLPTAVFYGANGAGKSNLIRAFRFVSELVEAGTPPKGLIPLQPFRLGASEREKSRFELRFFSKENIFNYGFEITAKQVCSEWLDIYVGDKATSLFERVTGNSPELEFSERLKAESARVAALETVGVRPNQLLLSAIRESIEAEGQGPLLQAVFSWFNNLFLVDPETHFDAIAVWLSRHKPFKVFMDEYFREAGTGLAALDPKPILAENRLSEAEREKAKAQLHASRNQLVRTTLNDGTWPLVDLDEHDRLVTYDLSCLHPLENGQQIPLPMSEESDGIQRLSELLVAMHVAPQGGIVLIDELDRSLHPLLAKKFIESFLKLCPQSQLIVTTHDTNLLDLELLRRDEIWFTEKDRNHATHIYPLAEFTIRNDLRVAKGYLQGRFGAVPFLGGLDSLIERTIQKHDANGALTSETKPSSTGRT